MFQSNIDVPFKQSTGTELGKCSCGAQTPGPARSSRVVGIGLYRVSSSRGEWLWFVVVVKMFGF